MFKLKFCCWPTESGREFHLSARSARQLLFCDFLPRTNSSGSSVYQYTYCLKKMARSNILITKQNCCHKGDIQTSVQTVHFSDPFPRKRTQKKGFNIFFKYVTWLAVGPKKDQLSRKEIFHHEQTRDISEHRNAFVFTSVKSARCRSYPSPSVRLQMMKKLTPNSLCFLELWNLGTLVAMRVHARFDRT